jgi:predicted nucleic-acid-binding protein
MKAADTNVVVRLLLRDDDAQTEAAEAFVARGAWVSLLVLMEACWVMASSYKLRRPELGTAIGMLLQHDRLVLEQPMLVASALRQFQAKPGAGFADCLILEAARAAGNLPLGTFDHQLAALPGAELLGPTK